MTWQEKTQAFAAFVSPKKEKKKRCKGDRAAGWHGNLTPLKLTRQGRSRAAGHGWPLQGRVLDVPQSHWGIQRVEIICAASSTVRANSGSSRRMLNWAAWGGVKNVWASCCSSFMTSRVGPSSMTFPCHMTMVC